MLLDVLLVVLVVLSEREVPLGHRPPGVPSHFARALVDREHSPAAAGRVDVLDGVARLDQHSFLSNSTIAPCSSSSDSTGLKAQHRGRLGSRLSFDFRLAPRSVLQSKVGRDPTLRGVGPGTPSSC